MVTAQAAAVPVSTTRPLSYILVRVSNLVSAWTRIVSFEVYTRGPIARLEISTGSDVIRIIKTSANTCR